MPEHNVVLVGEDEALVRMTLVDALEDAGNSTTNSLLPYDGSHYFFQTEVVMSAAVFRGEPAIAAALRVSRGHFRSNVRGFSTTIRMPEAGQARPDVANEDDDRRC